MRADGRAIESGARRVRRPGVAVRVTGFFMVLCTLGSIPSLFYSPTDASWAARVAVFLLWCWHGWGVFQLAWTVAPEDPDRFAATREGAGHPIFEPYIVENYVGWFSAFVAGWYLLHATGGLASWLVMAAVYFGIAGSLQLMLGLFRIMARAGRSALACSLLVLLAAGSLCQARLEAGQDAPTVGQAGKDVEWVPTPQELVDKMLEMADVSPQDVVMDLGSGDGRTVIAAAKLGARAIGIEYDPGLVALSQRNAAEAAVTERATFVTADLFDIDLAPATVITMFLLPDLNLKLRPALLDLKPGTRIVSNTWDMDTWTADETAVLDPCPTWCTALLWFVPAQVEGVWQLPYGELALEQHFQVVSGTLGAADALVPIEEGRMRGDQISFRARDSDYRGRVDGAVIRGIAQGPTRTFDWIATRVDR